MFFKTYLRHARTHVLQIIECVWTPPIIYFFIASEKYIQPFTSLHHIPNFSPARDMIFENFKQGVSN